MTLQGVEELEHRGDECGPDAKRRIGAPLHRGAARDGQQRLALRSRVRPGVAGRPFTGRLQSIEQALVELASRDQIGQDRGGRAVLDRSHEMRGGRARRHNDEAIARVERRAVPRERDERASRKARRSAARTSRVVRGVIT